jgi:hypothetical protein
MISSESIGVGKVGDSIPRENLAAIESRSNYDIDKIQSQTPTMKLNMYKNNQPTSIEKDTLLALFNLFGPQIPNPFKHQ